MHCRALVFFVLGPCIPFPSAIIQHNSAPLSVSSLVALNPQPSTLNPKPKTLNPKP